MHAIIVGLHLLLRVGSVEVLSLEPDAALNVCLSSIPLIEFTHLIHSLPLEL